MKRQENESRPARGRPRDVRAKRAILAATRKVLGEGGYTRLTIEGVAARSEVGKATIYRWWPSKGELVLEAVGDDIAIGTVPDSGNTRADLKAAIEQLIATFSRRLAAVVIFAAIATLDDDPLLARAFRDRYVYPWRSSAAAAIGRGVARGDLPPDTDVEFLLDVIVGTVFQRALVVREPATGGLARKLLRMILPTKLVRPRPRGTP